MNKIATNTQNIVNPLQQKNANWSEYLKITILIWIFAIKIYLQRSATLKT